MPVPPGVPESDDRPPFLGRWSAVYAVVLVWTIAVIAAVGAFSLWAF